MLPSTGAPPSFGGAQLENDGIGLPEPPRVVPDVPALVPEIAANITAAAAAEFRPDDASSDGLFEAPSPSLALAGSAGRSAPAPSSTPPAHSTLSPAEATSVCAPVRTACTALAAAALPQKIRMPDFLPATSLSISPYSANALRSAASSSAPFLAHLSVSVRVFSLVLSASRSASAALPSLEPGNQSRCRHLRATCFQYRCRVREWGGTYLFSFAKSSAFALRSFSVCRRASISMRTLLFFSIMRANSIS